MHRLRTMCGYLAVVAVMSAVVVPSAAGQVASQSGPAVKSVASEPVVPRMRGIEMPTLPVQFAGRIMPLDSLAREMIRQVTGQRSWGTATPSMLLLSWTWQPEEWQHVPMVLVGDPALQRRVGLPDDAKHFSYAELVANPGLAELGRLADQAALRERQPSSAAEGAVYRNARYVNERLRLLDMIFAQQIIRCVPPIDDGQGVWMTVAEAGLSSDLDPAVRERIAADWERMREAFVAGQVQEFRPIAADLVATLRDLSSPAWPEKNVIELEVLYNVLRPFQKGWWCTLPAVPLGVVSVVLAGWWYRVIRYLAWASLVNGLSVLTLGMVIRWKFAGHPPVSNMYESLVLMGWGVVLVGIVTMLFVRRRSLLPIVAGVATVVLVVADASPLDSAVSVLVPVLRNTVWLTLHVLTIMLAFGVFALTTGLGHVEAVRLAYGRGDGSAADAASRLIQNMVLVGCLLLAAGIVFGAVWASRSWGRYWGWDPKETWSLITLLGYMAVLHGWRAGWLRSFGLAMASILCFLLVVMTYYGVNFILGQGLHSYGFASGGQRWVGLCVLAEVGFVVWTWRAHSRRQAVASVAAVCEPASPDTSSV